MYFNTPVGTKLNSIATGNCKTSCKTWASSCTPTWLSVQIECIIYLARLAFRRCEWRAGVSDGPTWPWRSTYRYTTTKHVLSNTGILKLHISYKTKDGQYGIKQPKFYLYTNDKAGNQQPLRSHCCRSFATALPYIDVNIVDVNIVDVNNCSISSVV